jgi:hypothetical protein
VGERNKTKSAGDILLRVEIYSFRVQEIVLFSSVVDPDPHGSAFSLLPGSGDGSGFGMRIRTKLLQHFCQKPKFTMISEVFKEKVNFKVCFFFCIIIANINIHMVKVSSTQKAKVGTL